MKLISKIKSWAKGVLFAILGRQNLGGKENNSNVAFINENGIIEIRNLV
jgi:hypothetical protein